jgi:hypothetical protein
VADTPGILGQIAAAKRAELDRRFAGVSLDALRQRACATTRSLAAVLAADGARFILEIKKASPSAGTIRPAGEAAVLARGYAGVADALSVLTDRNFFGGSLDDLAAARARRREAWPRCSRPTARASSWRSRRPRRRPARSAPPPTRPSSRAALPVSPMR